MRNPNRIDDFCKKLAEQWHKIPQWRFGQFINNMVMYKDTFYMEDDEMIKFIENYVKMFSEEK